MFPDALSCVHDGNFGSIATAISETSAPPGERCFGRQHIASQASSWAAKQSLKDLLDQHIACLSSNSFASMGH